MATVSDGPMPQKTPLKKKEIQALTLEKIQTRNSIQAEEKIIQTLEDLVIRSRGHIFHWEKNITNLNEKLYDSFIKTLRETESFNILLDMEKAPGQSYADYLKTALKVGLTFQGIKFAIPKSSISRKINMRKFKKAFQELLDLYINENKEEGPYWAVIYIDSKRQAAHSVHIYIDSGV
jgi:hypothetical protein